MTRTARSLRWVLACGALGIAVAGGLAYLDRSGTAEDRRALAAATAADADAVAAQIRSDGTAGAADNQTRLGAMMPRTLSPERLLEEITALAASFDLEVVDTDAQWGEQLRSGRTISAQQQVIDDLGLRDLSEAGLVEPVAAEVSLRGSLRSVTGLMTALSERESRVGDPPELLLRRSDVVLRFAGADTIATLEVIGVRLSALPPEMRILIDSTPTPAQ
jgi:hypothetical protein